MRSRSVKHIRPTVMWNDTDNEWEDRPRNVEEQVELRRAKKTLADCPLPEEFRLVTVQPKQFWIHNQLVWGFKLAWARVDGQGRRGAEEYEHVARYEPRIADEVQMRWAVDDFTRELQSAERRREKVPLIFSMRMAS